MANIVSCGYGNCQKITAIENQINDNWTEKTVFKAVASDNTGTHATRIFDNPAKKTALIKVETKMGMVGDRCNGSFDKNANELIVFGKVAGNVLHLTQSTSTSCTNYVNSMYPLGSVFGHVVYDDGNGSFRNYEYSPEIYAVYTAMSQTYLCATWIGNALANLKWVYLEGLITFNYGWIDLLR